MAWVVFFPSIDSSLKSLLFAAMWTNVPGDMFDGMARAVSTISVHMNSNSPFG